MDKKHHSLKLWLVLATLLIWAAGCINVENPPAQQADQEIQGLGGSNGLVLIKHSNGKLYVVDLASRTANEVTGLPQSAAQMREY